MLLLCVVWLLAVMCTSGTEKLNVKYGSVDVNPGILCCNSVECTKKKKICMYYYFPLIVADLLVVHLCAFYAECLDSVLEN
jgi:hypothetical protein